MAHPDLMLFLLNTTNVIDSVDYRLFKIKETAIVQFFVTDAFKQLVELHDLKGLDFSEVYDSAFTAEKEEEQERNYQAALDFIERNKGIEVSYDEARFLMEQEKVVASGKWRMQLDENGELWLANLTPDLIYCWGKPIYIPPVLMLFQWHEVEKSEINL
ncbi:MULTISPECIES: hypothetical protein [Paenibacillus]|uniref:hypothetical protein n=1 Tax=Paenibacillus TaxID=44249 RepID=UPI00096FE50E|nr:hypothetical protein [Paenibacillus odorifer]OMD79758.1 hypothetical protein BSK50_06100 [Paenibacillus odorifer]